MDDQNSNSSSGAGGNPPDESFDPKKTAKLIKQLERKVRDSDFARTSLEQRYDNQAKLFDKIVEELDASKALIGEQFRKTESILKNISQGIVVVDSTLHLGEQMSRAIHEILGRTLPPNAHLIKDILDYTNLSPDEKSKVVTAILASVGEDELNFQLNSDSMPREMRLKGTDSILEVDWSPTLKENIIENFIVAIRDVTQVRQLQESAKKNAEHINYIIEIVENDANEINSFIKRCRSMFAENIEIAKRADVPVDEKIEVMFRNAHTVKGSARIYNLSKIVNAVHELESMYQDVRNKKIEYNPEELQKGIEACSAAVDIYADILFEKLNFADKEAAGVEEDRIFALVANLQNASTQQRDQIIADLIKEYKLRSFHRLNRVLAPIMRVVPDIAAELNKACPTVNIKTSDVMIHADISNVIVESFSHLMRNSLDHGLESPLERQQAGKDRAGTITVSEQFRDKDAFGYIFIEDDGRGLNLAKLGSLASAGANRSDNDLAEMIFDSGVSTAASVTAISGRGVGMNAVREAFRAIGGDVLIEFTGDRLPSGYRNFRFKLTIPAKFLISLK